MVELGAGYGAWLATVLKAAERLGGREVRLTGVEMVPEHIAWMKEHLRNNGADPDAHRILHGAVSDVDGTAVTRKVERLLISTHNNSIHRDLRRRFAAAGFETVYDFPVRSRVRTEYGDVQFLDGLLCVINPQLLAARQ